MLHRIHWADRAACELAQSQDVAPQSGSVLELTRDLIEGESASDAPTDLSTNPKHMEDYGKD